MAKLEKWFPFRFKRSEGKPPATQAPPAKSSPTQSPAWPGMPSQMRRLMDQMFSDSWFSGGWPSLLQSDSFFGDFSPTTFHPQVDVVDDGKHVSITAELPGLDKEDVELSVHEGALTIHGEKKHETKNEEEGCYRTERFFGSFQRTIPLPVDVELDGVQASFAKGVLTVRFPKSAPEQKKRTIPVS